MLGRFLRAAAKLCIVALLTTKAMQALAYDLKISGFSSIVGGKIIAGDPDVDTGTTAGPLFVADWRNGFLYAKKGALVTPETRAGIQGDLKIFDGLSATLQGVGRTGNGRMSLEWAYLSYDIGTSFTLQVGRKHIPIFYYSDFQDIGYAYIWVRPPGELYGWEITSYNGASLRHRGNIGDMSINSSLFGGSADLPNDDFFKIYYDYPIRAQWNNILGLDTEINYEWLTSRFSYIQSDNRYDLGEGWVDVGFIPGYDTKQKIYGLVINMDFEELFFLSEFNNISANSKATKNETRDYSMGAGYRIGKWTPFINYSDYLNFVTDNTTTPETIYKSIFKNWSFTLRYDFAPGQDLKLQYQKFTDSSDYISLGNSQLITLSYDVSLSSK